MKIRPVAAEFHMNNQRHDEAIIRFTLFCERT